MDDFEGSSIDRETPARTGRIATAVLVVLAVVAFEMSSNASVGVAIGCLKFAWDDVADGLWLMRVDPRKQRGIACMLIHAARGLIKASLCGFLGGIAIAIAVSTFGNRLGWPKRVAEAQLVGAALITVFGLTLAAFFGFVASWLVLRAKGRFRLWVGPETRWARQNNVWPPYPHWITGPRQNRAEAPLVAAASGIGCFSIGLIVFFVIAVFSALKIRATEFAGLVGIGAVSLIIFSAGGILVLRDIMMGRVKANHPNECWPESSHYPS